MSETAGLFPTTAATGGALASSTAKDMLKQVSKSAGGGGGKNFIKFTKQGEWLMGIDADDITGEQVAFNVASLQTGYIGWEDGTVKDEIMVPLADAGKLPLQVNLPEISPGDGNGWSGQLTIEIKTIDSGDTGLIKGSSGGYIRRLSEFMGELYDAKDDSGAERLEELHQIPVVQLECGGYKHRKYGFINEPKFVLVDWLESDGTPVGMEETAKAAAPKKGKAKLV